MNVLRPTIIAAAVLGATLVPAFAADPAGTWLTEEGKATIRLADCGGALCGTILALKEPNDPQTGQPKLDKNNVDAGKRGRPIIGVQIVSGLKPDAVALVEKVLECSFAAFVEPHGYHFAIAGDGLALEHDNIAFIDHSVDHRQALNAQCIDIGGIAVADERTRYRNC